MRYPLFIILACCMTLSAQVRLKDIATVEGVRPNALTGFGIVVGLNGTGDKDQTRFTTQALANALTKSGLSLDPTSVKVKNVALVLMQAELPAFARSGTRIDVNVSSVGDASSLQGGTLLIAELKGINGTTYAIAQGPISIGGFSAGGGGASVVKNHPTVGIVPNGAMVEREVDYDFLGSDKLRFILRDSDFTTMERAVTAVNAYMGQEFARPLDSRTLEVLIPTAYSGNLVGLISELENLTLTPDAIARVVINERTGTIIMGSNVRVDRVAIAHGSLTIEIQDSNEAITSPGLINPAPTVNQTNTRTSVTEEAKTVFVAPEGISLGSIAETLNALKVTPRDIIAILQAMKEAGALHAELKIM